MSLADDAPLLEVDHYSVAFRTPRGLARVVDDVSFTLGRGKTLGIVGESGSGKSVLNRSIMGLISSERQIENGSALFDGEQLVGRDRQPYWGRRIGMIFQDPMTSLNPVMKVQRQIFEPLKIHLGIAGDAARDRAVDLLTKVGIPEPERRLNQYPHELSGGMRQRVMIAIALAGEPELLIADEPTTALDVTVQKYILDLLGDLQTDTGMSMILITHDLGVARGRTDDVMVMYGGRAMEFAPTDSLFTNMQHPYSEALMHSIPRLDLPKHSRLTPIAGAPPDPVTPPSGCRFSPRCRYASQQCVDELPSPTGTGTHQWACFLPVGSAAGEDAWANNLAAGVTATGLSVGPRPGEASPS
ncbi:MAG: ABC transporter ATP-binding protein [Actinomycetota bacterium]